MPPMPNSVAARDVAYYVHPQTSLRRHNESGPIIIDRGEGAVIYDDAGKRYIETVAGLWCASLGFSASERIAQVAYDQLRKLGYYHTYRHRAHEASIDLAEKLIQIAPVPMSKVLFQCSGSEANDTAIKLAWYYQAAMGRPQKNKIIGRRSGYHGNTIAAVSVSGKPDMHADFNLPLPMMRHTEFPHYYRQHEEGESEEAFATRMADALDALIVAEGPDTVAAFFAEPVMGAGGAIIPPKTYFEKVQAVLRKHDVLFVADEVICGFGRTGNWWGSTTFKLQPDMLTCAKALSAAYQPISAVLINEKMHQAMLAQSDKLGSFAHGYTYSGHPVATAVALEVLKIYQEMDINARARRLGRRMLDGLNRFSGHPLVGDVAGVGLIAGIELVQDKRTRAGHAPAGRAGKVVDRIGHEHGLVLRVIGDRIAFAPPFVITEAEIDEMLAGLECTLDAVHRELTASAGPTRLGNQGATGMIRVAFDIGGTFTDFVLSDDSTGTTHALKVPTSPANLGEAVIEGLEKLLAETGMRGSSVDVVLHATTVATNAVLERKGAKTGLITTQGFRDVLIIGRQKRYETYDMYIDKPDPLVERRHIAEVVERVAPDGSVVTSLDMDSVNRAVDSMLKAGRETVAVSLLHAYANAGHEQRIREQFSKRAPNLLVSISSEVSPKFREYERTNTTVTNAYVRPIVDRYLRHLDEALAARSIRNNLFVMQSNGGLISPDLARDFPVRIIESGPAAGILMSAIVGKEEGRDQVITFDMGGTTAKLGAIDDGAPAIMPTFEVDLVRFKKGSGLPINVPAVEMIEIGAGGGSIVRDNKGMIVVGPDSAGADPGPICYGLGGREPTITDANVVLGYISPDWFNGGTMRLDKEAAERGIKRAIADPLGVPTAQAAWGIHLVATSNMENALRIVSVERGRDPRRYAMVAFGGAGPLHAARLARSVGIPAVIVPYGAGVGSAMGLLQAEPRVDVTTTRVMRLDAKQSGREIAGVYKQLEEQASHDAKRMSPGLKPQWSRYAQMRYAGQGFEIHVDLPPGPIDDGYGQKAIDAFKQAYLRRHKFLDPEGSVEAVDWTLVATIPANGDGTALGPRESPDMPRRGKRLAWFPEAGGYANTTIVNRAALADGSTIAGPAIVEDPDCTAVVLPGDLARMSDKGHVIIEINSEASQ